MSGFATLSSASSSSSLEQSTHLSYPVTPTVEQVDDYHGTIVADPYRWLEDTNSDQTAAWVADQNVVTFAYLANLPDRQAIYDRLLALWDYEKFGIPFKEGDRYFYFKNDGLQNQSVLYTLDRLDGEPRVLLDPNGLADDGTIALSGLAISTDGRWLAYGLAVGGSDWQEWHVRDVVTGEDLPDLIQWVKFSGADWTKDHQGFFYSRYDAPDPNNELQEINRFQKLYYHRLGTSQSEDVLIYDRPDQPEWGLSGGVTDDGRYLVISVWQGTEPKNLLFYRDLVAHPLFPLADSADQSSFVVELIGEFQASFGVIDNEGSLFYCQTDWQAPKGRVIAIDLAQPDQDHWREIIPEAADKLDGVAIVNNQFVLDYLKDARSIVKIFDLSGRFDRDLVLPGLGSVGGLGGDRTDRETFYSFTSYTTPTTIYRYDFATGESKIFRQPQVDFAPEDYLTEQVFFPSQDGTMIPMFLSYKKGLDRQATQPMILYGYGGFNISLTPYFSPSTLVWLERGGIYAVANLRGGGEYGEAWHEAAIKEKKQKTFDDFIAAAEWAIANGYTTAKQLAISGGSNGGLLVGACLCQRPDLFGAALPAVGVLDMLRFHKFTIGWAWQSDYGCPDDPNDFATLYAYSPLHNLKPGTAYPATLITTGDRDDRVVPAHSFKFAAALQAAQAGPAPVLIRIETQAGHGAGKPTTKQVEEASDCLAFLTANL